MKLFKTVEVPATQYRSGYSQEVPNYPGWIGLGTLVLGALFVIVTFFNSFTTVPSGYVGIVTTFSRVTGEARPGFVWKLPYFQSVVPMNVQVQAVSSNESAATNDLQTATTTVVLNYHLEHSQVDNVYVNLTTSYQNNYISPVISEAVKSVTAQYTAEELLTERSKVTNQIESIIASKLQPRGIVVDNFSTTNFAYSPTFQAAIENKQAAQQQAQQAQYNLQKAQLDAQANQVQDAALTPAILEQQAIAKWNGKLPTTMTGSSNIFSIPVGQ